MASTDYKCGDRYLCRKLGLCPNVSHKDEPCPTPILKGDKLVGWWLHNCEGNIKEVRTIEGLSLPVHLYDPNACCPKCGSNLYWLVDINACVRCGYKE